jgi:hypothetical protein
MEDTGPTKKSERTFPADPTSVAAARSFVAEHIRGLPVDLSRVILLTSELVTNSLVHAGTPVVVRVQYDRIPIRVEVEDFSHEAPFVSMLVLRTRPGAAYEWSSFSPPPGVGIRSRSASGCGSSSIRLRQIEGDVAASPIAATRPGV